MAEKKQIAEIEYEQNYGEDTNKDESGHITGRLGLKEEEHVNVEFNSERKAQRNQRLSLFQSVCEGCIFGFFALSLKMRLGVGIMRSCADGIALFRFNLWRWCPFVARVSCFLHSAVN